MKEKMVLVPFSKEDGQILEDTCKLMSALLEECQDNPTYRVYLEMCLEKLGKIEERYLEQRKNLKSEKEISTSKLVPKDINTSTKEIIELPKSNIAGIRPEIFALDFWNNKYRESKKNKQILVLVQRKLQKIIIIFLKYKIFGDILQ